ncbi:23S rRNA (guanine(745)-N(1))-methyltransferase [Psychrosphaera saromensis]|nr:methyltransferase domain-containing protein [Psychrosphaera saromensis]GHB56069.1 23S rRNA (guanine(745)-N(1))-methyltransferase [Psychrosphaera saromensis]GLQ13826.1 23S rRNA (guanine(745)-N(1))-methyltransferase [Psychrosphaera saromensis]
MFDFAKEGYINLLPVQLKNSLQPGDDKNMVLARREFLLLGHYDFLRQALVKTLLSLPHNNIIDLGCGEGYYTDFIQSQTPETNVYGVDISKSAVKYAAKRNKQVHYCVATNSHVPFADNFSDIIVNVFAPLIGKECQRVLNDKGRILSVSPGAQHLIELKQCIYDTPELHDAAKPPEGFALADKQDIEQQVILNNPTDVENLLTMTPFGWKISEQNKQSLLSQLPFQLTLSFTLNQFTLTK